MNAIDLEEASSPAGVRQVVPSNSAHCSHLDVEFGHEVNPSATKSRHSSASELWDEETRTSGTNRVIRTRVVALFMLLLSLRNTTRSQEIPFPHNAVVCERCHSVPAKFGSSSVTVRRVGEISRGHFIAGAEGGIRHSRGESSENGRLDRLIGQRASLNLLGDGYIEAIDGRDLERNAQEQHQASQGIGGIAVQAPVFEARGSAIVRGQGRFGWKSQHSSLMSSCADSLRNELGVRNRLNPDEYPTHASGESPTPFDTPNPRTRKTELDRLVEEIRHTAPPPRDENLAGTEAARAGEKVFDGIGCAICHVPTYKTLPPATLINGGTYKVPRFLGNKVIHPYSDFLVHDVGTGDGIPQAAKPEFLDQSTANKFRTPPLWGLRFRATHLMHDGDTSSPERLERGSLSGRKQRKEWYP
jgi:hypothetical protein